MNRKQSSLVSSTPHPQRSRHLASLFDLLDFSPIAEPNKQPTAEPSTSSGVSKTGAARKRRIVRKEKDVPVAPKSVTAGVLEELGVKAEDICNNALSHSRNLYNMFPEPILIDSDSEENSIITKKNVKKPKQDSKTIQSSTAKPAEEKKSKEPVPGSSRSTHTSRDVGGRKLKKQSLNSIPSNSKDLKTTTDTQNKLTTFNVNTVSAYQSIKSKIKDKDRLSLELDEKYPIEWSNKRQKNIVAKAVVSDVESIENNNITCDVEKLKNKNVAAEDIEETNVKEAPYVLNVEMPTSHEVKKHNKNKAAKHVEGNSVKEALDVKNVKVPGSHEVKKYNTRKGTTKPRKTTKSCRNEFEQRSEGHSVDEENSCPALVSRFEDVVFKANKTTGAIVAKCLKTDENDIGYLEVPARTVFKGQTSKVTFVVMEGKAKVLHGGVQQTLSPGDMLHIRADSGYQFESEGSEHVRFLYVKKQH